MKGLTKTQIEAVIGRADAEIRALEKKLTEEAVYEETGLGTDEIRRSYPLTGDWVIEKISEHVYLRDLITELLADTPEIELNDAEENAAQADAAAESRRELEEDR